MLTAVNSLNNQQNNPNDYILKKTTYCKWCWPFFILNQSYFTSLFFCWNMQTMHNCIRRLIPLLLDNCEAVTRGWLASLHMKTRRRGNSYSQFLTSKLVMCYLFQTNKNWRLKTINCVLCTRQKLTDQPVQLSFTAFLLNEANWVIWI